MKRLILVTFNDTTFKCFIPCIETVKCVQLCLECEHLVSEISFLLLFHSSFWKRQTFFATCNAIRMGVCDPLKRLRESFHKNKIVSNYCM